MDQACLSCHKEINALIERGRGLHAKEGKTKCASCHPDHAGKDFQLVNFKGDSVKNFDHKRANWALDGKHGETKCEKCHKSEFRKGEIATLSVRKSGVGWLGVEQSCVPCHEADDSHKKSLGQNCARCHDIKGWKPAPIFDHDTSSKYLLTGKHKDVKCEKCHNAERLNPEVNAKGAIVPVYKPVPHKDCIACHADAHKGRLTGACDNCHLTSGWHDINKKGFDHDNTKYPLRGGHVKVACSKCHIGFPSAGMRPAFAHCTDCHSDPHESKATLLGKVVDCASCHEVDGFKPSTYTVAQHAQTKYALEGKHIVVKCAACHTTRTITVAALAGAKGAATTKKVIDIRVKFEKCTSCHADDHGGQLASKPDKGACEGCHKVAGFKPSTYTIAQHAKLKVTLDGRHGEIECGACHSTTRTGLPPMPGADKLGKAKVLFKVTEIDCSACHGDAHGGRFTRTAAMKAAYPTSCAACHSAKKFRPSTYDYVAHAKSGFPLDGAHRAVACVACHDELKQLPIKSTLVGAKAGTTMAFTTKRVGCVSCHEKESPHGTQFAHRKDKGACEGCHGAESFTPASKFNHDKDTSFPLAGAHAKVPCADCHIVPRGVKPAAVAYRPLSGKCESCHANPVRQ